MLIVCKLQKQTSVPHLGIHGEELRPGQEAQSEHSFALHQQSFNDNNVDRSVTVSTARIL